MSVKSKLKERLAALRLAGEPRKFNRRQSVTPAEAARIIEEIREGKTLTSIAERLGRDPSALGQHLRRLGYNPQLEKKHATFKRHARHKKFISETYGNPK